MARCFPVLFLFAILFLACGTASAQMRVELRLRRRTFIPYEPIEAIITITNLTGHDVVLENVGDRQWLDVQVNSGDGGDEVQLTASQPDYKLNPLLVRAGETVKRAFDIGPHFAIRESGGYRVRTSVYLPEVDRYFTSNVAAFDLTSGKLIFNQTVGVPGSGEMRTLSLVTLRLPDHLLLYARVRDEQAGVTYTTQSLGRLLTSGEPPDVALDRSNELNVLFISAPGTYIYDKIGLGGEILDRVVYETAGEHKVKPRLTKLASGMVEVRGGQIQVRPAGAIAAGGQSGAPAPKLSDRPSGLPEPMR